MPWIPSSIFLSANQILRRIVSDSSSRHSGCCTCCWWQVEMCSASSAQPPNAPETCDNLWLDLASLSRWHQWQLSSPPVTCPPFSSWNFSQPKETCTKDTPTTRWPLVMGHSKLSKSGCAIGTHYLFTSFIINFYQLIKVYHHLFIYNI